MTGIGRKIMIPGFFLDWDTRCIRLNFCFVNSCLLQSGRPAFYSNDFIEGLANKSNGLGNVLKK